MLDWASGREWLGAVPAERPATKRPPATESYGRDTPPARRQAARHRAPPIRRRALRRLREDAGLTRVAVASAAGIDPSYMTRIEERRREAGYEVLATVGAVLGADLSVRLFPNTGPTIHDRTQAPMGEALLRC